MPLRHPSDPIASTYGHRAARTFSDARNFTVTLPTGATRSLHIPD